MERSVSWVISLTLLFSACRAQTPTQVVDEIHPELMDIPVYSEATGWVYGIPQLKYYPDNRAVYSHIARSSRSKPIVEFYKEIMSENEWELFMEGGLPNVNDIESIGLYFSKPSKVADINIMEWTTGYYLVSITFYDDPILDE